MAALYSIRYVHKIAPRDTDRVEVELPDTAFADRKTLAKELRKAKVIIAGTSLYEMRVEGDKCVVFPRASVWHSLIITKVDQ